MNQQPVIIMQQTDAQYFHSAAGFGFRVQSWRQWLAGGTTAQAQNKNDASDNWMDCFYRNYSAPNWPLSISDFKMKLPSVTMFSPAFTPSRICTRPDCSKPSFTTRFSNLLLSSPTKTIWFSPSVSSALSEINSTLSRIVVTISTSANMPAFKRPSALFAAMRTSTVREPTSTWLPTSTTW